MVGYESCFKELYNPCGASNTGVKLKITQPERAKRLTGWSNAWVGSLIIE